MSRTKAPPMDIVRIEDKETKLKTFIKTFLDDAGSRLSSGAVATLLVVARSLESPVAKAVAAMIHEMQQPAQVRIILAMIEPVASLPAAFLGQDCAVRVTRDARLLDAHEQLVLGPNTSWVGDCMRRDPMKRDAYECFASDSGETAGWARISFERLWALCEPVVALTCDETNAVAAEQVPTDAASQDADEPRVG